jgi:hypothetical protein
MGSTTIRLRRIRCNVGLLCPVGDQRLPAGEYFDTDTLYIRWTLAAMRKDLQRDLPSPDEARARHHCLREGMGAPDLAMVGDFFRYYISLSHDKIVDKLTVDLIKINAE